MFNVGASESTWVSFLPSIWVGKIQTQSAPSAVPAGFRVYTRPWCPRLCRFWRETPWKERGSREPTGLPRTLSSGATSPVLEDSQLLAFGDAPWGPYLEILTLENIFYKIVHLVF